MRDANCCIQALWLLWRKDSASHQQHSYSKMMEHLLWTLLRSTGTWEHQRHVTTEARTRLDVYFVKSYRWHLVQSCKNTLRLSAFSSQAALVSECCMPTAYVSATVFHCWTTCFQRNVAVWCWTNFLHGQANHGRCMCWKIFAGANVCHDPRSRLEGF